MSVELPEAYILAGQMNTELAGKQIASCSLQNCAKYQQMGFVNMYLSDFERLRGCTVEAVASRGNTIRVKLDKSMNLLLAPEYGGITLFYPKGNPAPSKYTLKLDFTDESAVTVTLTGMGIIHSLTDEELQHSYVYRRDFSAVASPVEAGFTYERFSKEIAARSINLKALLVGKDAVVVGLGNAAFQDILYRAGIHPKHKGSELTAAQQKALFDAVRLVVEQRIRLGGKSQFVDFYGRSGAYVPAMGPNMKGKICPSCGTDVAKLSLGGGQVYVCPTCQK